MKKVLSEDGVSIIPTRRSFLKLSALTGAGMLAQDAQLKRVPPGTVVYHGHVSHPLALQPQVSVPSLARYVDPLPTPPVVRPLPGSVTNMQMVAFKQKLHRDLPATPLWCFNGMYPGPTLETRRGSPIRVNWQNHLPTTHFLPVDPTIHGAEGGTPAVRTIVHVHGHKVLPESDGYPEAWFTSDGKTGPEFFNPQPF